MKSINKYYIVWWIIALLWWIIIFLLIKWKSLELFQSKLNQSNIDKITFVKEYLIKNFNTNYPYPKWDIILLDKNLKQIHLQDKSVNLESIDNLYVIQWNLWSLDVSDKKFLDNAYDSRFSKWENKKYFTYSVTKDKKKFQIWSIKYDNNKNSAYIVWNISWSIIKDIDSNHIIQNNSKKYLPYLPTTNNKYKITLINWSLDSFEIKQDQETPIKKSNTDLEKWIFLPLSDDTNNIELTAKWTQYIYKITYPNWNIQTIWPNKDWLSDIKLNFKNDWIKSNVSIVNTLWKIAYNMVRIWEDSQYNIQDDKWWVLVIRWTQFSLDIDNESTNTLLLQWTISLLKNNQKYLLTLNNNTVWFTKNNEYINLYNMPDKLKSLYAYTVGMDIFLNPAIQFSITKNQSNKAENELINDLSKYSKINSINSYSIKDELWNQYLWIDISWYFGPESAISLVKEKKYINDVLDSICKWYWYNKNIELKDASSFLTIKQISTENIIFNVNNTLENWWINLKNKIIPISNISKNNANLTFFDTIDWQIVYKNISSNNQNDNRDWIFLICTK